MMAVCDADALEATARGSNCSGTSAGNSACIVGISNARAQPTTNTKAKMRCSVIQPITLPVASVATATIATSWHTRRMWRRSKRSAMCPTTSTSANAGKNCTSPTRPRSRALPVNA